MPPELERLAEQLAPLVDHVDGVDCWCPMLSLLRFIGDQPLPRPPYLKPDPTLVEQWRIHLGDIAAPRKRIGVAWSVGQHVDGDYPRAIALQQLTAALDPNAAVFSVQAQGESEALACGVYAPRFEDFADCAAFMSLMDGIVTVDTAAAHLAGAIAHPNVNVLLSYWSSWRWLVPWYDVTLRRQKEPGDWSSVLAKLTPVDEPLIG
jgi:ADP-heptose:LPS heptosyltransferase